MVAGPVADGSRSRPHTCRRFKTWLCSCFLQVTDFGLSRVTGEDSDLSSSLAVTNPRWEESRAGLGGIHGALPATGKPLLAPTISRSPTCPQVAGSRADAGRACHAGLRCAPAPQRIHQPPGDTGRAGHSRLGRFRMALSHLLFPLPLHRRHVRVRASAVMRLLAIVRFALRCC